jgi:hypothetical protein
MIYWLSQAMFSAQALVGYAFVVVWLFERSEGQRQLRSLYALGQIFARPSKPFL